MLGGVRTRGNRFFLAGAAGIARATPSYSTDAGTTYGTAGPAFAYDLSAHTDYRIAGLQLAISGVVGPPKTSYVAVTLGAELGWFGY